MHFLSVKFPTFPDSYDSKYLKRAVKVRYSRLIPIANRKSWNMLHNSKDSIRQSVSKCSTHSA